jgi:cytochrome c-type biogenesis protein CcmH/NrfG
MLFVIIFIITIISIFYIFQNIKRTNYLQNKSGKLKSPQLLFVIFAIFIFFLSSSIYYKIGNPFINMEKLNASKLKLIQSENKKNSMFFKNLKKFNELLSKSKTDPNNLNILLNLASTASKINKTEVEISSLKKILSIKSTPKLKSLLAQAMVKKADGQVTSKAQNLINQALIEDPFDPGANFLNGLAQSQIGNEEEAFKIWVDLYKITKNTDTWKNDLEVNIRSAAKNLGISNKVLENKFKTNLDYKNSITQDILNSTEENQKIKIDQMVAQLADRLTKSKQDLDGWLKLFRSYKVLNNREKALDAIKVAIEISPDNIALKQMLLKELLPPSVKPNFTSEVKNIIAEILILDSTNIDALFFQGLNAFTEGNNKLATRSWNKLLSKLPKKSPMRLELSKKLQSIKDKN